MAGNGVVNLYQVKMPIQWSGGNKVIIIYSEVLFGQTQAIPCC